MSITIFGTPVCPNCNNVKNFLSTNGVSYDYKNVGDDIQQSELEALVERQVRSVPVIVSDGKEVSFDELKTQVSNAQLTVGLAELSL